MSLTTGIELSQLLRATIAADISSSRLAWVLSLLVLMAPLFRLCTLPLFLANERIQYLATFSRMDVIALGCLLALMLRHRPELISPR